MSRGLKIVWRSGVAHAYGTVAGQRIRRSLGTGDQRQAEELLAHLEARLWKRHSYGEAAVRTFEEAALSYLETGVDPRFIAPLVKRFRGRLLGSITPGEVQKAAVSLYPAGSPATRNRQAIVPTRAIINHAAGLGWCPHVVVRGFPVEKPKRVTVGRDWIDAFLAQADRDGLPHLAAAVLFMWQAGPRVGEVVRVEWRHVDLGQHVILLERTKTGAWEPRHITQELVVRLANLPRAGARPVFGYADRFGIRNRMKAVCQRAGIPFVPPHQAGRHSFATNALAMGATAREVMEAGGWKTARLVLETYAHANEAGRSIAERFDTPPSRAQHRKGQAIDE